MPNAHIVGWGKHVPGRPITNADLVGLTGLDLDNDKIHARTGIHARHFAEGHDSTASLAVHAATAALEMADVDPDQLDLIIVGTNSPDNLFPATACRVQDALGASRAGAFDLSAGCPGFLYGLIIATQFIRAGTMRTILVIGAECVSRIMNMQDRGTCAFFGDGAGAVVLAAGNQPGGVLGFTVGADGSGAEMLILPAGGSRLPLSQRVLDDRLHFGRMDGNALYRFGLRTMPATATEALRKANVKLEDIDLFIPHQSNARLIEQVSRSLKIPDDKVFVNIHRYANTSTAALPIAMCDAVDAGRLKPGDHVLFATYGAGLTSAGAVVQWAVPTPVKPLPRWHRTWHVVRGAGVRLRSRWLRLVHGVDHQLGAGGR